MRILYATRSTTRQAKRNRGENGAQMSGSGESSSDLREKKIPNLNASTDPDEQEDPSTGYGNKDSKAATTKVQETNGRTDRPQAPRV